MGDGCFSEGIIAPALTRNIGRPKAFVPRTLTANPGKYRPSLLTVAMKLIVMPETGVHPGNVG